MEVLSQEEIHLIHEATLEILEQEGVVVLSDIQILLRKAYRSTIILSGRIPSSVATACLNKSLLLLHSFGG